MHVMGAPLKREKVFDDDDYLIAIRIVIMIFKTRRRSSDDFPGLIFHF